MKHNRIIRVLPFLIALTVAGCAQTQQASKQSAKAAPAVTKEFARAVPVNEPITLDDFFFANARCEAIDFTLQISKPPGNGEAIIKPSSTTLSDGQAKSGNPSPRCMGRKIASKAVVYRPNSGYTGADAFEVRFTNSRDPSRYKVVRYLLTVQ